MLYAESQPTAHTTPTQFFPTAYRACSYTPSYTARRPSLKKSWSLQSEPESHDSQQSQNIPTQRKQHFHPVAFSFGSILCSLSRGPRYCARPCEIKLW